MSTAELIFEKARQMPEHLQNETLHYVDFLLAQQQARVEDKAWTRFSSTQLAAQYAPEDSVYDEAESVP